MNLKEILWEISDRYVSVYMTYNYIYERNDMCISK